MENLIDNELLVGNNSALDIRSKIYEIRGEKVMLDFDLAKIYGYTTKAFNQQVKNNIEKFAGDIFRFQLTKAETETLSRSNFLTSMQTKGTKGGRVYLPYAFTEAGIYMLMTVLHGELATRQSRELILIFRAMKNYIMEQHPSLGGTELYIKELDSIKAEIDTINSDISSIQDELTSTLKRSDIAPILLNFTPDVKKELVFVNGELTRASDAYINIYSKAKKSIIIIDDYIDIKTLLHLRNIKSNLKVTIFSDNKANTLRLRDYNDFKKDYKINIELIRTNKQIHDRFIILDINEPTEECYHSGSSTKDTGKSLTMLTKMEDGLAKTILKNIVASMIYNKKLELK